MKHFLQVRTKRGDDGTFGHLVHANFHLVSLELPWRDNLKDLSCIPVGIYNVVPDDTGKHQYYRILDVPGRGNIEMHPANWAGDTTKGLLSDLRGCLAVGLRRGKLNNQECILDSNIAFERLKLYIGSEDFQLEIIERISAIV